MHEALYLATAECAAHAAGRLLKQNFGTHLKVDKFAAHDIKLELDTRAQHLIEQIILSAHPDHAILGEEGIGGNPQSVLHWVIDPLDGTINYYYGIPHFCVSVALVRQTTRQHHPEFLVGVIYDPIRDELFTAAKGQPTLLNGQPCHVSTRTRLAEAIVSVGITRSDEGSAVRLPVILDIVPRVRKCRLMGSAALDLAYVACGRLDLYVEAGVHLWDLASGVLLVRNAGGEAHLTQRQDNTIKYRVVASSGLLEEVREHGWTPKKTTIDWE